MADSARFVESLNVLRVGTGDGYRIALSTREEFPCHRASLFCNGIRDLSSPLVTPACQDVRPACGPVLLVHAGEDQRALAGAFGVRSDERPLRPHVRPDAGDGRCLDRRVNHIKDVAGHGLRSTFRSR